jgi:hypothetical protein
MKKVIVLLTFIILAGLALGGCAREPNWGIFKDVEWPKSMYQVSFNETNGNYLGFEWYKKSYKNVYTDIAVPNGDTAITIANAIMKNYQYVGYFSDYKVETAVFDTERKVWIIIYGLNDPNVIGTNFVIVIRQDNAQVVKMLPWG